jgi:hypothetical protein
MHSISAYAARIAAMDAFATLVPTLVEMESPRRPMEPRGRPMMRSLQSLRPTILTLHTVPLT